MILNEKGRGLGTPCIWLVHWHVICTKSSTLVYQKPGVRIWLYYKKQSFLKGAGLKHSWFLIGSLTHNLILKSSDLESDRTPFWKGVGLKHGTVICKKFCSTL